MKEILNKQDLSMNEEFACFMEEYLSKGAQYIKNDQIEEAKALLDYVKKTLSERRWEAKEFFFPLELCLAWKTGDKDATEIKRLFITFLQENEKVADDHFFRMMLDLSITIYGMEGTAKFFLTLLDTVYSKDKEKYSHILLSIAVCVLEAVSPTENLLFFSRTFIQTFRLCEILQKPEFLAETFELILRSSSKEGRDEALFELGSFYADFLLRTMYEQDSIDKEETIKRLSAIGHTLFQRAKELKNLKCMVTSGLILLDHAVKARQNPTDIFTVLDKIPRENFTKEQALNFQQKMILFRMNNSSPEAVARMFYELSVITDSALETLYAGTYACKQYEAAKNIPICFFVLLDIRKIVSYYQDKNVNESNLWQQFGVMCAELSFSKLEETVTSLLQKGNFDGGMRLLSGAEKLFDDGKNTFKQQLFKINAMKMVVLSLKKDEEAEMSLLKQFCSPQKVEFFLTSVFDFAMTLNLKGNFFAVFLMELIGRLEKQIDIEAKLKEKCILTCLQLGENYSNKIDNAYFRAFFVYRLSLMERDSYRKNIAIEWPIKREKSWGEKLLWDVMQGLETHIANPVQELKPSPKLLYALLGNLWADERYSSSRVTRTKERMLSLLMKIAARANESAEESLDAPPAVILATKNLLHFCFTLDARNRSLVFEKIKNFLSFACLVAKKSKNHQGLFELLDLSLDIALHLPKQETFIAALRELLPKFALQEREAADIEKIITSDVCQKMEKKEEVLAFISQECAKMESELSGYWALWALKFNALLQKNEMVIRLGLRVPEWFCKRGLFKEALSSLEVISKSAVHCNENALLEKAYFLFMEIVKRANPQDKETQEKISSQRRLLLTEFKTEYFSNKKYTDHFIATFGFDRITELLPKGTTSLTEESIGSKEIIFLLGFIAFMQNKGNLLEELKQKRELPEYFASLEALGRFVAPLKHKLQRALNDEMVMKMLYSDDIPAFSMAGSNDNKKTIQMGEREKPSQQMQAPLPSEKNPNSFFQPSGPLSRETEDVIQEDEREEQSTASEYAHSDDEEHKYVPSDDEESRCGFFPG